MYAPLQYSRMAVDSERTLIFPFCLVGVNCFDAPIVEFSTQTGTGTRYQDTVTYTCDEGYTMDGVPTVECSAPGAWSGEPPTCTGKTIIYYLY